MKILVTGATGFIGKNLVKRLKKEGHFIGVITRQSSNLKKIQGDIDINICFDGNTEFLVNTLQNEKFDGVVHLATLYLSQHKTDDIKRLVESNIIFSTEILEAACNSGIKWFINTGTLFQHYNNATYSPTNLYSATKQAFEDLARYYWENWPIDFVTLKLNDTYGPGDTRKKIFNIWQQLKPDESLEMSAGEQLMDILYIDDVVEGFYHLITMLKNDNTCDLNGENFALYAQHRYTLKELASIFENVSGKKLNIEWGKKEYREREVMLPCNTIKKLPDWIDKTKIEEGILKVNKQV